MVTVQVQYSRLTLLTCLIEIRGWTQERHMWYFLMFSVTSCVRYCLLAPHWSTYTASFQAFSACLTSARPTAATRWCGRPVGRDTDNKMMLQSYQAKCGCFLQVKRYTFITHLYNMIIKCKLIWRAWIRESRHLMLMEDPAPQRQKTTHRMNNRITVNTFINVYIV